MDGFVYVLCFCAISLTCADPLKFTTTEWTLPGTFPGAPPIKFTTIGDTLDISCQTNDPTAQVKLLMTSSGGPGGSDDRYVSAVKRGKGRVVVAAEHTFRISQVTADDEGKYKCVGEKGMNKIELFKGTLAVKVPEIKQIVPVLSLPGDSFIKIERNGTVEINCSAPVLPGSDESYLKWYRSTDEGEVRVPESKIKKLRVTKDGKEEHIEMLSFEGFDTGDIGQYVCKREVPDGYTTYTRVSLYMKGFCLFYDQLQPTGVRFVSSSCTASCKCQDSNAISCVSLCPPHYVICPPGQIEVALPVKVSETPECSCKRKQCVNDTDHCYYEDKLYTKGQRFVSKGCMPCKCNGFNSVTCVSLCPPKRVRCRPDQLSHYEVKQPDYAPGCYCKYPTCLNITDVCKMQPESGSCYALFRRWHYDETTEQCKRFDYGGCEGNPNRFLKKDVCENTCNPKITTKKIIPGDCEYEGKWYKIGENFISNTCKSNCTCADRMSITCEKLCPAPPAPSTCGTGTMLVLKPKAVSESPRCFCEEATCLNTEDVCTMEPEAGSCYAAYRRWHFNPSSQTCVKFIYGGCEGNPNNFLTKEECRETCVSSELIGPPASPDALKVVTISGKIKLSSGVGTLPKPSCASIKLIEKTTNNAEPQASSSSFSVSEMDVSRGIDYQLLSTSGDGPETTKSYSLSAVVNVGWCKDQYSNDWIRENDYVTKTTYDVVINGEKERYNVDVDVAPI